MIMHHPTAPHLLVVFNALGQPIERYEPVTVISSNKHGVAVMLADGRYLRVGNVSYILVELPKVLTPTEPPTP